MEERLLWRNYWKKVAARNDEKSLYFPSQIVLLPEKLLSSDCSFWAIFGRDFFINLTV
jgi:hypothetical protein